MTKRMRRVWTAYRLWMVALVLVAGATVARGGEQPFDVFGGGLGGGAPKVAVSAQFTAPTPDRPARLFIVARIEPGWHIYSITQAPNGPVRTEIELAEGPEYKRPGPFASSPAPDQKVESVYGDGYVVESHHGTVVWHAPIEFAPGVDWRNVKIEGRLRAQPCDAGSCLQPTDFPFTARPGPGVELAQAPSDEGAAGPTQPARPTAEAVSLGELLMKLVLALLGGLILNLMPCVLPVISLKLLSFMNQAGESRRRVFELNVWYALGLISVFMVLATMTASAGHAWGEQFTLPWFKILLTALVFVMALSFLGVWEIPIPGFVGGSHAGQWQAKEGATGAFFKGAFATILATPCSGPFLAPLFGFLLGQPPYVVYLIFGAVGLGMASPYLVLGVFPQWIRFMPKPGAWMDTFQQLMAFLLLGTVVFLFTTISAAYFVPTLTLLVGLWFACWLIGRTPVTAGPGRTMAAWGGGAISAALVGLFAFTVLLYESQMPWQPFSPEALTKARAEGKTVMVDFTADWCLTCKTNLKFAIDRKRVRKLVDDNRVVPLLADWTDKSPTIKKALNDLGYNSIPVLVIWPADPEQETIVLVDVLIEDQVIDALKKAGPSRKPSPPPVVPPAPKLEPLF